MHNQANKKVIAAVIVRDGKYLIAQPGKNDSLYEKWEFPGGKMESGETEHECLKRELFEEFGIKAEVGSYLCSSYFEHKGSNYEMRTYIVTSYSGEFTLFEHKQIRWVSPSEFSMYDFPEPDYLIIQALLALSIK